MSQATHCFEILLDGQLPPQLPEVIVAHGDDGFLRRETVACILSGAGLTMDDLRTYDGEECKWLDVHDELATLSLFDTDARRVAMVTRSDKLIKDARVQLEKWCDSPVPSSLLILQVNSFPSNTKLAKTVTRRGWSISCTIPTDSGRSKSPSIGKLKHWLAIWASTRHSLQLSSTQVAQILDAVGTDCGLLHQELGKLALYANEQGQLSEQDLRSNLGTWRTRTMWEIADAIADGNISDALAQLEKVFAAGEHPAAVVPQVSWSLRRFGKAAHLILQAKRTGRPLSAQAAISQCGFWGADAKLAEARLRRMGLARASRLLDWLLELDLKIKGTHSNPDRAIMALEQLCLKFA